MSATGTDEAGETSQDAPAPEALLVDGVTVTPGTFRLVDYDAAEIAHLTREVATAVGLPADLPIRIEVDETTPLGRAEVISNEPLVLELESGALEHLHRPRQLSIARSQDMLGRMLMRVRDRLDPTFGDPPGDLDLEYALSVAWDIYAIGRLARLGLPTQRERRLYHFRLRHGFSDHSDEIFEQLWGAEGLTWADVERLSIAARAPAASTSP
jgi:hypothetical protein